MTAPRRSTVVTVAALSLLGAAVAFVVHRYEPSGWVAFVVDEDTGPLLFVLLMATLPVVGFPVSVFLFLAGTKFGLVGGMLLAAAVFPLHLGASFLLSRSVLRPALVGALRRFDADVPRVPPDRVGLYTFLFLVVPGLPYAVKNYLLAVWGVPLRYYFALGWTVNLGLSLPVVGLGGSAADLDLRVAVGFLALLVAGYAGVRWLQGRVGAASRP